MLFFLHHPASQVAVAAVATTVTLEEAAAHGAVGFEAHTDDVVLLFQSILMFSPLLAPSTVWKLKADLKPVTCIISCSLL